MGEQFLEVAQFALQKGHMNAFVENLFAATESMAKGFLMMTPDRAVLKSKKHRFVATHFNLEGKHQRVNSASVDLLNCLAKLRPTARYGTGAFDLETAETGQLYEKARAMLQDLESTRPKRN